MQNWIATAVILGFLAAGWLVKDPNPDPLTLQDPDPIPCKITEGPDPIG